MSDSQPITSDLPTSEPAQPPENQVAESAPEIPSSDAAASEEPLVERIRKRVRAQTSLMPATMPPPAVDAPAAAPDRMQTLEERLIKLEELLTRQVEASRAPVEVAEIAPPVAPIVAETAPVATMLDAPMATIAPPGPEMAGPAPIGWRSWFLIQSLSQGFNNFRLFLRMYVDPRYKMTWLGRLVPLLFILFFVFSDWDWAILRIVFFWNNIPIFGTMINKLLLIAFAWVTVKVLGREMRRYQYVVPDVPDALRWGNR